MDDLCHEINNTLKPVEKVYLLLLVQDSLLSMHETPGFVNNLNYIFDCIGVDNSLVNRFRKFLEHDDPVSIDGNNYLLLSPREKDQDEMLEGRWIEDNAPRISAAANTLELDEIRSHMLVMFIDQIQAYAVRCFNITGAHVD